MLGRDGGVPPGNKSAALTLAWGSVVSCVHQARPESRGVAPNFRREKTPANGGLVALRQVRSTDGDCIQRFITGLTPRSRYQRFCGSVRGLSDLAISRLVLSDGKRSFVLLAFAGDVLVGMGEYFALAESHACDIALVIQDAWQGQGLGSRILAALMARAREASFHHMEGVVLWDNVAMLKLADRFGFSVHANPDDPTTLMIKTALSRASSGRGSASIRPMNRIA